MLSDLLLNVGLNEQFVLFDLFEYFICHLSLLLLLLCAHIYWVVVCLLVHSCSHNLWSNQIYFLNYATSSLSNSVTVISACSKYIEKRMRHPTKRPLTPASAMICLNATRWVSAHYPAFCIWVFIQSNGMIVNVLMTATKALPTNRYWDGIAYSRVKFKCSLHIYFMYWSADKNVTHATVYRVNKGRYPL